MALFASSYIPTVAATVTRNADQLSFPFVSIPEPMTIYVRFIEAGSVVAAVSHRIVEIGAAAGSNPRLMVRNIANLYSAQWFDAVGNAQTSGVSPAPSLGDNVEFLVTLTSSGIIQFTQVIGGGAPVVGSASSARVLPQAWSAPLLWVNSFGSNTPGFLPVRTLVVVRGVQSLGTMQRLTMVN